MSRIWRVVFALTAGTLAISGGLWAQSQAILIATGGTGGAYYPLGVGIASLLSKHLPGVHASAQVTGGSVDNLRLIGAGRAVLGLAMGDAALDALNGVGKFQGNKIAVRTLMVLYPTPVHVISVAGRGIEKIDDLKGKRVSTGSPGSATEIVAFQVLEAMGFDKDKDIKRERLSVGESVNAIKEDKIDAFFWVGAVPTPALVDLAAMPDLRVKLIDTADLVGAMNRTYSNVYSKGVIKAGSYSGQIADNAIVVVQNLLVASETMPEQLAYNIVKTLMEKKPELVAAEAEHLTINSQIPANSPIPFHPGAAMYVKENGAGPR